jgi:hypothetical protein
MHAFHATKINSVKKGGPNASTNSALAAVLEKVKELDVPRDIVERNIKKATEKGQEAYIEKIYEVSITSLSTHLDYLLFLKDMIVSSCFEIGKHKFSCAVVHN